MKKVVLAVLILILIIVGGVLENVYITRTFQALDQKLKCLESSIKSESKTALADIAEINELFAYSPDVRAFSVALAETQGSLECGDFDNALSKCHSLIVMADGIRRVLDFNAADVI